MKLKRSLVDFRVHFPNKVKRRSELVGNSTMVTHAIFFIETAHEVPIIRFCHNLIFESPLQVTKLGTIVLFETPVSHLEPGRKHLSDTLDVSVLFYLPASHRDLQNPYQLFYEIQKEIIPYRIVISGSSENTRRALRSFVLRR